MLKMVPKNKMKNLLENYVNKFYVFFNIIYSIPFLQLNSYFNVPFSSFQKACSHLELVTFTQNLSED